MEEVEENKYTSIDELCAIKEGYVDKTYNWYRDRSTWPRITFRLAGVTIIVLSLTIPFFAAAEGKWSEIGVPLASLSIAILSSLNAFFGWQKMWEKRITTQLTLEGLMAAWEIKIAAAKRTQDLEKGYVAALQATQDLIENTRSLSVSETASFFTNIKFPDPKDTKNSTGN